MQVTKDGKEATNSDKTIILSVGGLLVTAAAVGGAVIGMNLANLINGK